MSIRNDPRIHTRSAIRKELDRLIHQGRFLGELSTELLLLAGLKPGMRLAARVERGANSDAYRLVTDVTRTLLPLMERTGVASAAEVDIATLPDRMREEVARQKATPEGNARRQRWCRRTSSPRGLGPPGRNGTSTRP